MLESVSHVGPFPVQHLELLLTGMFRAKTTREGTMRKVFPTSGVSLVNFHAKLPNETFANQIQWQIKMIIHHEQLIFIPGIEWSNPINAIFHFRKREDNYLITSIDAGYHLTLTQCIFMIQLLIGNRKDPLNRANIILNGTKYKCGQECPLSPILLSINWGS